MFKLSSLSFSIVFLLAASWRTAAAATGTTCVNDMLQPCPCGPACQRCGSSFPSTAPQFHVRDDSCSINDPNFPFWDPLHGLYHLFYQDHLAQAQGGQGQGPVIGHVVSTALRPIGALLSAAHTRGGNLGCDLRLQVSADLVTWARMPVAIWNDQDYDSVAIYR